MKLKKFSEFIKEDLIIPKDKSFKGYPKKKLLDITKSSPISKKLSDEENEFLEYAYPGYEFNGISEDGIINFIDNGEKTIYYITDKDLEKYLKVYLSNKGGKSGFGYNKKWMGW